MILYVYTNAPDLTQACATTLADLASLVTALQDQTDATNAATLARIATTMPQIGLNDNEPLQLFFYDDAATPSSWMSDGVSSVSVSVGKPTTDGSFAYATGFANTYTTSRNGVITLNTPALLGYLYYFSAANNAQNMSFYSVGNASTSLWLQIAKTDGSGNRVTFAMQPISCSLAILGSATPLATPQATPIPVPSFTVATLPNPNNYQRCIACVTDATNAAGANLGSAPTGGGAVIRMVYATSTAWLLM